MLQQAIWAGMVGSSGNVGASDAEFDITSWTAYESLGIGLSDFESSSWGGPAADTLAKKLAYTGNVKVLNMYKDVNFSQLAQDQLGLGGGDTIPPVPEPATVVIWSALGGAAACAVAARRRKGWSPENRQAILDIVTGHKA